MPVKVDRCFKRRTLTRVPQLGVKKFHTPRARQCACVSVRLTGGAEARAQAERGDGLTVKVTITAGRDKRPPGRLILRA